MKKHSPCRDSKVVVVGEEAPEQLTSLGTEQVRGERAKGLSTVEARRVQN